MNSISSANLQQFGRFLLIGGFSTIINYLVFLLLLHAFYLHYLIANVAGFISGLVVGYPFNKKWTFKHDEEGSLFHSYLVVYLGSLVISIIFLKITTGIFGIPAEISNIFAICITTCTNFLGTKIFVFRHN